MRESHEEVGEEQKWTGHVERIEGKRLTKRVDALRVEGRKRRRLRGERFGGSGRGE